MLFFSLVQSHPEICNRPIKLIAHVPIMLGELGLIVLINNGLSKSGDGLKPILTFASQAIRLLFAGRSLEALYTLTRKAFPRAALGDPLSPCWFEHLAMCA